MGQPTSQKAREVAAKRPELQRFLIYAPPGTRRLPLDSLVVLSDSTFALNNAKQQRPELPTESISAYTLRLRPHCTAVFIGWLYTSLEQIRREHSHFDFATATIVCCFDGNRRATCCALPRMHARYLAATSSDKSTSRYCLSSVLPEALVAAACEWMADAFKECAPLLAPLSVELLIVRATNDTDSLFRALVLREFFPRTSTPLSPALAVDSITRLCVSRDGSVSADTLSALPHFTSTTRFVGTTGDGDGVACTAGMVDMTRLRNVHLLASAPSAVASPTLVTRRPPDAVSVSTSAPCTDERLRSLPLPLLTAQQLIGAVFPSPPAGPLSTHSSTTSVSSATAAVDATPTTTDTTTATTTATATATATTTSAAARFTFVAPIIGAVAPTTAAGIARVAAQSPHAATMLQRPDIAVLILLALCKSDCSPGVIGLGPVTAVSACVERFADLQVRECKGVQHVVFLISVEFVAGLCFVLCVAGRCALCLVGLRLGRVCRSHTLLSALFFSVSVLDALSHPVLRRGFRLQERRHAPVERRCRVV